MKILTKTLAAMTVAAMLATGCIKEEPNYRQNGTGGTDGTQSAVGYLSLEGLSMRVIYDAETETRPDDTANETQRPSTRADETQPAVDDFLVEILDAEGKSVLKQTYGELKTAFAGADNRLELPVGSYTMRVRSEEETATPAAAWEHPVYGTTVEVPIRKNEATSVGEVVCKLQSIKVTVLCSADLAAKLTDDTASTVSLGDASMTFALDETRAAYFLPQEESNTLEFKLTGKFADTQEPTDFSKTITGVKAGQWRKIALVISHADKGDIQLDITVDNFVEDEEIVVDGTDDSEEPGIEEPGTDPDPEPDPEPGTGATIVWKEYDIDSQQTVTADMRIEIDVTAPKGIRSFVVSIESATLTPLLPTIGLPAQFDLCQIEDPQLQALLGNSIEEGGLGFPINDEVRNQTYVPFSITYFVQMLVNIPGEHNFKLDVTDNEGVTVSKTVQLLTPAQ